MTGPARLGVLVALVVAAAATAGATPFVAAAVGALAPADFARDYVTARARLVDGRGAPPPEGEGGNARAVQFGAPEQLLYGAPYHAHPPPARLLVRPLGLLAWRTAALVWAAASLVALGWLAISLLRLAAPGAPPTARVALAFVALALWPPVLHCLEKGQWSILLAALLADGLVALTAGRQRRAGVLFGLAAALKATPILLLGLLVLRHRRSAVAMATTVGLAVVASLAVDGTAPWRAFFGGAARNAAIWAPWTANTASLAGVTARLFGSPGPFARPLVALPALAMGLYTAIVGAFVLAALLALRRPNPLRSTVAAWLALPVLANPLGWSHVLVMLLAPLAVALRSSSGTSPGSGSAASGAGAATRRIAWVALIVFSIPRATLSYLAGPIPVAPARGLVLGIPALAAATLFVALTLTTPSFSRADDARRKACPHPDPLPQAGQGGGRTLDLP
ncbi:MAG TPA: glycosyltransferase family 87 protein [Polyangia bacterium]|nr:glycosyltransferase family 87 protein [Polyangia bacterium]